MRGGVAAMKLGAESASLLGAVSPIINAIPVAVFTGGAATAGIGKVAQVAGRIASRGLLPAAAAYGAFSHRSEGAAGMVRGAINQVDPTAVFTGHGLAEKAIDTAGKSLGFLNPTAKARSDRAAAAPAPNGSGSASLSPANRSGYTTKDGRSVEATDAQARAWQARRKD